MQPQGPQRRSAAYFQGCSGVATPFPVGQIWSGSVLQWVGGPIWWSKPAARAVQPPSAPQSWHPPRPIARLVRLALNRGRRGFQAGDHAIALSWKASRLPGLTPPSGTAHSF